MNLNDRVWVKLTPEGQNYLRFYLNGFGLEYEEHANHFFDANGFLTTELWQLMSIFGNGLCNGGPVLFEGNMVNTIQPARS